MSTYQLFRKLLACTLALLLAIDIAAACRLWSACDTCSTTVSCGVVDPCASSGCGWSDCGSCGGCSTSCVTAPACGCSACNGETHHGEPAMHESHHDHEHGHHHHGDHSHHDHGGHEYEHVPTPAQPAPFADGGFSSAPLADESEAASDTQEDIFEAGDPDDMQPVEPAQPAIDLVAPAPEEDIAEDLVAPEPSDDMLFGDEEPVSEVESAFDEEPTFEDDTAVDGGFGQEEPDAFMNAEEDESAAEEELFGFDDAEPAVEEMPAEDPADEAADAFGGFEEPADDGAEDNGAEDDLFGFGEGDPAADETPVEEPAQEMSADDFGAFEEDATESAEDDLFGFDDAAAPAEETPAEQMPADEPAADDFGDGFGDDDFGSDDFGAEDFDAAEDAAEDFGDAFDAPPAEEADEAAEDDLFGDFGMILSEPGGYDSDRPRTWIDNSGRFSCQGRLIAIDGDTVRLQKTDGGVSRVPLGRLSNADLEFVSRQAIARHDLETLLSGSTVRTAAR